jgi:dihydrofolate reductase
MGKLIYSMLQSFDGYVADPTGSFDWAEPDEDVHTFINELSRPLGTFLFGRRMYEVMVAWETLPLDDLPAYIREFAGIWRATDKIVFSRTLETVSSARTRIERGFDPEEVRRIKEAATADLGVGGPDLAGQALRAGLVDECHFFLVPILVGGGTRALPRDVRLRLDLVNERRFAGGIVHVHYRVRG